MQLHAESHVDHGLTEAQLHYVLDHFGDRCGYFAETIELPPELGDVPCALVGPIMGDAPVTDHSVAFIRRGDRDYYSRCVVGPTPRRVRQVSVIGGPHDGTECVLYTAFGGPLTPQEPMELEARLLKAPDSEHAQIRELLEGSRRFWAEHALIYEGALPAPRRDVTPTRAKSSI